MDLKENERIDDLEYKGLKIIQNENYFCFGIDSILLSDFAKDLKKDSNILDIGTGTGIISILLSKKTECKKIYALEIQKEISEMAGRSIKLNNLENQIELINDDIKLKYILETAVISATDNIIPIIVTIVLFLFNFKFLIDKLVRMFIYYTSSTIFPSSIFIILSATFAISRLCVIIIIVCL